MDQKTKDVINGFFDGELTLVVEPIYITRILIDNIPFKICNSDGTCNEVIAWGTAQISIHALRGEGDGKSA